MSIQDILIVTAAAGLVLLLALPLVLVRLRRHRTVQTAACTQCGATLPRDSTGPLCQECQAATPPRQNSFAKYPPDIQAGTPRLVAVRGPLVPREFPIGPAGLSIGRHPDNDIVLSDELMVSRFHAVITMENGQCVLYDRDSVNGTWVNDGPSRCWPEHFQYDVIDATPYVRDGANEIVVIARYYGVGDFHPMASRNLFK